jgi:hypothetical protein
MTLPNFFIIGAAKSGTTALYRYLRQHPEIFMTERKELHHFSYTYVTKQTNGPNDYIRSAITDEIEYEQLFDDVRDEKAIGEASPTYIYVPGTAERIYEKIPHAKLIAILRNPADRAYSAFMHCIRDNRETVSTFKEALDLEDQRVENNWGPIYHYKRMGFYYEQLARYYSLFPKEQIKIVIYDDFSSDPNSVISDLYQFLGVDSTFEPDMSSKPNVSGVPKNKLLQKIMNEIFAKPNPIRSIARFIFSDVFRWRVTSSLRNKNLEQVDMPQDVRNELISLFRSEIISLQSLIDRDLSSWLLPMNE